MFKTCLEFDFRSSCIKQFIQEDKAGKKIKKCICSSFILLKNIASCVSYFLDRLGITKIVYPYVFAFKDMACKTKSACCNSLLNPEVMDVVQCLQWVDQS